VPQQNICHHSGTFSGTVEVGTGVLKKILAPIWMKIVALVENNDSEIDKTLVLDDTRP
jgi:hypothetical protein